MSPNTVVLTIPADQSMMLVMRMTTSGVMARAGLTLDVVDDLKMAVEEACNCLLMQDGTCGALRLSYQRQADRIVTTICSEGICVQMIDEDTLCVIQCILESMVDEVLLTREDGCVRAIQLTKYFSKLG